MLVPMQKSARLDPEASHSAAKMFMSTRLTDRQSAPEPMLNTAPLTKKVDSARAAMRFALLRRFGVLAEVDERAVAGRGWRGREAACLPVSPRKKRRAGASCVVRGHEGRLCVSALCKGSKVVPARPARQKARLGHTFLVTSIKRERARRPCCSCPSSDASAAARDPAAPVHGDRDLWRVADAAARPHGRACARDGALRTP